MPVTTGTCKDIYIYNIYIYVIYICIFIYIYIYIYVLEHNCIYTSQLFSNVDESLKNETLVLLFWDGLLVTLQTLCLYIYIYIYIYIYMHTHICNTVDAEPKNPSD